MPGSMVFFTVYATVDSLTLLVAMTGLLLSSGFSLKAIADLEYATWYPVARVGSNLHVAQLLAATVELSL